MPNLPPLLAGIGQAMQHLSERQKVIAQNVANSETPGFKAREVEKPDFGALLATHGERGQVRIGKPRVTITSGMAALGASQPGGCHIIAYKEITETKPDGNNVSLEEQLLKMGQVQADYATMTNLYRKQMSLMKTATGRGS